MTSPIHVVVLAAGKGKRMHSALPKVLHPIAGRPLLRHVLDSAAELHPARTVVVYGHGGEAVRENIQGPGLAWVRQEPQLGTGHAVAQALPELPGSGRVLVLYGDVPLISPRTLERLLAAGGEDSLAILTQTLANPAGYGRIVRDHRGAITGIVEEKDASAEQRAIHEINTGIMVIPGKRLAGWLGSLSNKNAQGEYYLTDVVGLAVRDGVPVVSAHPQADWEPLGVNSKTQLAELERIYQLELARGLMEKGVTLADPARIDIRGQLSCGRDVVIDVGCVFEGRVELGDGVRVGPYCVLRDTSVGADTEIAAFSHSDSAQVGPDCRIGPYARLRPGAALERDVHVGNFVEVKNASFGPGSKANHLAYVGDSTVGRDVNIGAGTITCNYDGANKHRTVIEDEVFIGSDTQLVAPVTVGKGATVGAGTTVTGDVPPGALVISRVRQKHIDGWKRPVKTKKKE